MTAPHDVAQHALDFLHAEVLQSGETVIWKGRPDPKRVKRRELFNVLAGAAFAGFALFWMSQVFTAEPIVALFGLPFVFVGGMLMTKPWRMRRMAGFTYYAITDQRVIILKADTDGYEVTAMMPEDLNDVTARYRGGADFGDLRLRHTLRNAPRQGRHRVGRARKVAVVDYTDGLWGVTDLAAAEAAVAHLTAGRTSGE